MSGTESTEPQPPPPDEALARNAWFYRATYRILHDGLKTLLSKVHAYKEELEFIGRRFDLNDWRFRHACKEATDSIEELEQMIAWGEKALDNENLSVIEPEPSFGALRLLKAGAILESRRWLRDREVALKQGLPQKVLQLIDTKVDGIKDIGETGVLNGLAPAQIFLDAEELTEHKWSEAVLFQAEASAQQQVVTMVRADVQIYDEALKDRCLPLLDLIKKKGDESQLDTVVTEMSRILEDRIRVVAGLTEKMNPDKLMGEVFHPNKGGLLKFSDDVAVQQGVFFLFSGYSAFIRNEVMHRLVTKYTVGRVEQLLGFVDYLLYLLTQAEKPPTPQPAAEAAPSVPDVS